MTKIRPHITARNADCKTPYLCKNPWPEHAFYQCGSAGTVFIKNSQYQTAFFEAFPRNPNCFIRGEGISIEEAEKDAWDQYQRIINCKGHDFARNEREDGYGQCTKCPLSGFFLEPLTKCHTCRQPAAFNTDINSNWYCEEHYYELSPEIALGRGEGEIGFKSSSQFLFDQKLHLFEENQLENRLLKDGGIKIGSEKYKELKQLSRKIKIDLHMKYHPVFGEKKLNQGDMRELIKISIPIIIKELLENN